MSEQRYRVVAPVVLGAIVDDEQSDIIIEPDGGHILVRVGATIFVEHGAQRVSTTTEPSAIEAWLAIGHIAPIVEG